LQYFIALRIVCAVLGVIFTYLVFYNKSTIGCYRLSFGCYPQTPYLQ